MLKDDIFGESLNSDGHEQSSSDTSPQSFFDPALLPEASFNSPDKLNFVVQPVQTIHAPSSVKRSRKSASKYDGIKMVRIFRTLVHSDEIIRGFM